MTDSSFAEELRSLSAAKQKEMPSNTATEHEVEELEKRAIKEAKIQAGKGLNSAYILLDKFERLDEKNKKTKLGHKKIPAFESAMKRLGLTVVFESNMYCGWCNMNDCEPREHYGYKITW